MNSNLFENTRLETEHLVLKTLEPEDAQGMLSVVSQPNVMKFLPEDVMTLDEVEEIIAWLQDCYKKNRADMIVKWTLGVVWKRSSEIVGWCGLGPLDFDEKETEIFCGLSESYWGKGLAAEACRTVLDYAFSTIGLKRTIAVVNPENRQSVRLIEKLGMRLEKQVFGLPSEFKHYEGFYFYSLDA